MEIESSPPFSEDNFMKPEKLHLTFGVMNISENKDDAIKLLNDCLQKIVM